MTFQTIKNDENNRGKKLSQELKNALRVIWLGKRDSNFEKMKKEIIEEFCERMLEGLKTF